MTPGHGQFGPQGLDLQDSCKGPLNIPTYYYISSGSHVFREEDFFYVLFIISLWELMTTRAWPVGAPGAWLAGFM